VAEVLELHMQPHSLAHMMGPLSRVQPLARKGKWGGKETHPKNSHNWYSHPSTPAHTSGLAAC
jgi:hypothetical protein